jgi:pterin-4a-carbinolamine dehydratase
MPDDSNPIPNWQRQDLPPMLSRRFEFGSYQETRRFLDGVAKVAEAAKHYPSISFGKTYASISLDADGKKIGPDLVALAQQIDNLASGTE